MRYLTLVNLKIQKKLAVKRFMFLQVMASIRLKLSLMKRIQRYGATREQRIIRSLKSTITFTSDLIIPKSADRAKKVLLSYLGSLKEIENRLFPFQKFFDAISFVKKSFLSFKKRLLLRVNFISMIYGLKVER